MEVTGKLARTDEGWECRCDMAVGVGQTPEAAIADWLLRFEYKGPPLPFAEKILKGKE